MKPLPVFVALVLGLASPAVSAPQGAPIVREIEIRNVATGRVDQTFVLSRVSSRKGSPLDHAAVNRDVRDLLATKAFSTVDVDVEPVGDEVRLVYKVRPRMRLAEPVQVVGADHMRDKKIRELLGLQPDDFVDDQVLGASALKVVDAYREKRFEEPHVTWAIDPLDAAEGLARVTVTIQEGRTTKVAKVIFTGNRGLPLGALEKAVDQRSWWNPLRWILRRNYDVDELEDGRLKVLDLYLNAGYLDATVSEPVITRNSKGDIVVRFDIVEGTRYRCGDVTLSGVSLFPEAELRRVAALKPGQVAGSGILDASEMALRDFYGSRGYVNTRVQSILDPVASQGVVRVRFAVTEGNLTTIGNILIRGNTRTKDKVIRRELLIYPGDILDEVKAKRSERRLTNLGYFETVRRRTLNTDDPNRQDVVFDVDEKRTGQLMVGAGFSTVDNIVGYAELSQGNFDLFGWPHFTGGGQKLKLRTEFGSTRKDYEISFIEPWFLDRQLSFGVDLYRSEYNYSDYDVRRTGAALTLGKSLFGPNRVDLRYQFERSEVSQIDDTNTYFYADETLDSYRFVSEEDRLDSSMTLTVTHDTRDNPFFPSRGNRSSVFGSASGNLLGGDTELYRLGFRAAQYVPLWFGHVLSFKARYEIVDEYGDAAEVPIDERLFIGGGRTVRGFDYRDVGPKVTLTPGATTGGYKAVGGRSLALGNIEYTLPIVSKLRLGIFYDIGNVWRDPYEFHDDNLAAGAGVGIRFDIPGFPIRIDRAWAVQRDSPLTDTDEWVVWIGFD